MKARNTDNQRETKQGDQGQLRPLNSVNVLANRWGTTYRNLHRQISDGRIMAIKLNGILRVPQSEVERIEKEGF